MITPDDEITYSEKLLNLSDVTARIRYLTAHDCRNPDPDGEGCDSNFACPSCYGDAEEELAALRELETEMTDVGENASAIGENYMDEFIYSELDGIYGEAVKALSSYLDWDSIRGDRESDMTETTYRGGTYYLAP